MSKLAEFGTLIREDSAGQTIWRIEWLSDAPAAPQPEFSLTFVPPVLPLRGLLFSLGLHLCVLISAGYFQWWPFANYHALGPPREQLEAVEYQPLIFSRLPSLAASSASPVGKTANGASGKQSSRLAPTRAVHSQEQLEEVLPKSVVMYAGPQEIISNLPDATNRVQTIRRPDLVAPPKLKFPILLPSMVMLPPPALPIFRPVPKRQRAGVGAQPAPILVKPALPIPAAMQNTSLVAQQLANMASAIPQAAPALAKPQPFLSPVSKPGSTDKKAVIVLNAVTVPPQMPLAIPNWELSGSFAVLASVPSAVTEGMAAISQPSGPAAQNGLHHLENSAGLAPGANSSGHESGSGRQKQGQIVSRSAGGSGTDGNGRSDGTVGPRGDTGMRAGAGAGGLPGIIILGASSGSGVHGSIAAPRTRQGYGITIISGGTSGGATRDLGTFGRSETVYTVYIPMSDAGGGADWPMQYSMASPVSAGSGLLSPPLAIKKVAAKSSVDPPLPPAGRIFLAGIITEHGELRDLHAVRPEEVDAQIAIAALQQWQFEPAELNGQAVATKVLIGVTITNSDPRNAEK